MSTLSLLGKRHKFDLVGDPDVVVGLFDLRLAAQLVRRQCGRVGVHGVVGIGTAFAAFQCFGPSFDSSLKWKN